MGGNGSFVAYLAGTLTTYSGKRYIQLGEIDGVKVLMVDGYPLDSTPMNSFTSSMYYIADVHDPSKISTIAFYDDSHTLVKTIDIEYMPDGQSIKPYKAKDGKKKGSGTHVHTWPGNSKGGAGRKSGHAVTHYEPSAEDWVYINKALKYSISKN